MPVKMIATRRHFLKAEGRDVEKDEPFTVADDREADRLIRMRRARRESAPSSPAKPVSTRAMKPETSSRPAASTQQQTAAGPMTTDDAQGLVSESGNRRYARRDMRSED